MAVSVGANLLFVENEFDGPVAEVSGTITVGTSVTRIVANDPEGLALTIINTGTQSVYLLPTDDVAIGRGILLVQAGGTMSLNVRDDQTLPSRSWYGIVGSDSTILTFLRTRRYALSRSNPND